MTFFMPAPGIIAGGGAGGSAPLFWPPVLRSSNHGSFIGANVTLPPTVAAGDLLLINIYKDAAANHSNAGVSGFTRIAVVNNISNWRASWNFARISDGTEGGTVAPVTGMSTSNTFKYSCYAVDMGSAGTFDPAADAAQDGAIAPIEITRNLTAGDPCFMMGHRGTTQVMTAANADTVLLAEAQNTVTTFISYKKTLAISGSTTIGHANNFNSWGVCLMERFAV